MIPPKVCDGAGLVVRGHEAIRSGVVGCNGVCVPLLSPHHPVASEWYCKKCHLSYTMKPEEFKVLVASMPKQTRG
jgi:hypothetical protein